MVGDLRPSRPNTGPVEATPGSYRVRRTTRTSTALVLAITTVLVWSGCSRGDGGSAGTADTKIDDTTMATIGSDTDASSEEVTPTTGSEPVATDGERAEDESDVAASTAPTPADSAHRPDEIPGRGPIEGVRSGATVVIDPGHNGNNWRHTREINRPVDAGGFMKACNTTGTAGDGLTEAAFNLALAETVRTLLVERGIRVVMTRTDDDGWGPCIDERGLTARRENADLLLSIHADGSGPADLGFHVISPTRAGDQTDVTVTASLRAAALVRDALVSAGFRTSTYIGRDGLIQRGDLGTLNRAGVPAVMLEAGNMKNTSDLAMLASPEARRRMADALSTAVLRYLAG